MVTSIGYCIAHVTLLRFTVIYPPALHFYCRTFFFSISSFVKLATGNFARVGKHATR